MRPGNYPHERWEEISAQIQGIKMHMRNKHHRVHKPSDNGFWRDIFITSAQAELYDYISTCDRDANNSVSVSVLTDYTFNIKSLERLVYNKIIKIKDKKIIFI